MWAALDVSLNREVAVKILSATSAGPAERERLRREARLLAALEHPRITMVFDFVEVADQMGAVTPVLVTEVLDGMSLEDRLRSGPLEPGTAFQVCAQLADALAVAHRAGITHRDVKPGNVMLTSRGVKLLDFGIARGEADTQLTGSMMVIGTPVCMAPEQWSGRGAQPASDVYALGCVLYWCLAGHAPYPPSDLGALGMAHLQADPPALPVAVPASIADLYRACMAKDPAQRPSTEQAYAVLAAPTGGVTGAASGPAAATRQMQPFDRTTPNATMSAPNSPTAPSVGHRAAEPAQRRATPALLIGGGVLLVVIVVALVLSLGHGNSPSTATPVGGSGSPAPTTSTGPSVGSVVVPDNSAATATSASPSPSQTPSSTPTPTPTATPTSTSTPTPTPTTSSPSSDQATAALDELQTIAGQLNSQQQASPDSAYQDLLSRVSDMQQSISDDEQNKGPNPYHDVQDKIDSFDQQLTQDVNAQQVTETIGEQVAGEMQQVSTDLSSGN